jgi:hypothetical protein
MWVVKQFSPSTNLEVTGVEVTPVRDGLPFPPAEFLIWRLRLPA